MDSIDYLAVGHITKDLTPNGPRLGGTVAFASLTADALGLKAGIATSISNDMRPLMTSLTGLQLEAIEAPYTSTFENIYRPEGRLQILSRRANDVTTDFIAEAIATGRPTILHVGPLTNEINFDVVTRFDHLFVGITPQGWMREWNGEGTVSHRPMLDGGQVFTEANAVVMSIEDIDSNETLALQYAAVSKVLIVTRGAAGCTVFIDGLPHHVDAISVDELEPTGAGDVFAAAFFAYFSKESDPLAAARFASIIAGHSVRFAGLGLLNTPEELQRVVDIAHNAAVNGIPNA